MEDPFQNSKPEPLAPAQAFSWQKLGLWIVGLGVFIILVSSAGLYFWYQRFSSDHLIKLAPVDSVIYVRARNSFLPWNPRTLGQLPFDNYYSKLDQSSIFSSIDLRQDILNNSDQAALALVLKENFGLVPVFFFEFKDLSSLELVLPNLSNHLVFDKNILVVSESQQALDKVRTVDQGLIFSLASQVDLTQLSRGLISGYLNASQLQSYLFAQGKLVDTIYSQLVTQDVYLNFQLRNKVWQFNLVGDFFDSPLRTKVLTHHLPNDFSIFISNINLVDVFNRLQGLSEIILNEQDLDPNLLDQSADVIIFNQTFNQAKENVFGFDYILVLANFSQDSINSLERVVKIILSQKLPQPIRYFLPDGSQVFELLANVDFWHWQNETINNLEARYLIEPSLNFEISHLVQDNKLIIASSRQRLAEFISTSTQRVALDSLISRCSQGLEQKSYLIFNTSHISSQLQNYLPTGMILAGSTGGCIIE